ncbi:hypothetical protein M8R20_26305 [Pseudomonas sp. R2.Fl]|nr:hypothetical protein [Pseudomonas sp. R2.Fl]MCL6710456.1 hypothetical protein [Pseudomonas sp. R2.Fl]MCL6710516.1 hypothetical protein [Pseudomonas sp. R2.Fl]
MTTVAEFAKDVLGTLQVINPVQPVSDADMQTVIRFLNRFMTRLEANGTAVGWSNVSARGDVLPVPLETELGLMYAVAMTLAPQYGVSVMPEVAAAAGNFMNEVRRDQAVATPIQPILDIPAPDGWSNRAINGSTWYVG